jgi:hypothetical protein
MDQSQDDGNAQSRCIDLDKNTLQGAQILQASSTAVTARH